MADTIPSRIFHNARKSPYAPAYHQKRDGSYHAIGWKALASEVEQAGKALMALGLAPGDTVALLGFNRLEWVVFDLAAMAIGGVPAGIYTTSSTAEVEHIAGHSGARVILVEDTQQWNKVRAALTPPASAPDPASSGRAEPDRGDRLPRLRHVVTMRNAEPIDDPMVLGWNDFLARGDHIDDVDFEQRLAALEPGNLATLIYTSGTTGPPKGVMLSHQNLLWTANAIRQLFGSRASDSTLSFLPLSHIAEQLLTIHLPAVTGASVYFAESVDKVLDNLKEVQPTIVFGVPRIWEKFHSGVSAKLDATQGGRAQLVAWVRGVATEVSRHKTQGERPGLMLGLQYRAARRLLLDKLKVALGMGRARFCVSGAAPIAKEVLDFFASLDLVIHEVYGQSEGTGPTTFNAPGATKLGSAGPPLPGVEVAIAEDGEVLVRGNNVFLGYYHDDVATAATLTDGWLHSGDLGHLDEDGFLYITGRKKEIIITAGGKNIAPSRIEGALKNHPLISEAVVIGDRRKYLTALITIDADALAALAGADAGPDHPAIDAEVRAAVDTLNRDLAQVETIKKFTILPRGFTIDRGELTPTLKVKRQQVAASFAEEIEAMYR